MRKKNNSNFTKWLFAALMAMVFLVTSCVDKLTNDRIYTFKGEMVTDYLQNRKEKFSDFITVLQRAKIYDLLTTYGTYTCFAPTNTAITNFLNERGLTAVSELSDADCDTLAYNHLIKITYFTTDLNDGVIPTTNMLDRYLSLSVDTDAYSNVEYFINKTSKITLHDDSVENGVVHTVDRVLSTSNDLLPDMLEKDTTISLFYSAIVKTGFADQLLKYIDPTYSVSDDSAEIGIKYHTGNENEIAFYPKVRKFKYTGFIEQNSVYEKNNITNLTELTIYAKQIYDATYPEDAGRYDNDFTNPKNPLNRFVAYHFLDRLGNYNELTVTGDIKLRLNDGAIADVTDYYETMCPHTLIRCSAPPEGLFINRLGVGSSIINNNRGVKVAAPSETSKDQSAVNGVYHYIDDILCYSVKTRDDAFNTRFRFDATTLSPDFMSSGARGRAGVTTCTGFKAGSVKDWIFTDETLLSVRNRHLIQFWCYQGDEVVLLHQFDFSFKLPPVPEGMYEIRLGYVIMPGRGIIQAFFGSGPVDGVTYQPCGIPLDLRLQGTNPVIGWVRDYTSTTAPLNTNYVEANKAIDKALHNRGYMKGADVVRAYTGSGYTVSRGQGNWIRRILITTHLSATEDHYLRFKQVLDNNKAEFAFDYIELCPKNVYASEAGEDTH